MSLCACAGSWPKPLRSPTDARNRPALSLDKRVAFANENKADLFLSIHVNWMEPHTIRALETYYVGPTDDPATLKLASRENKDSDYSLSRTTKKSSKKFMSTPGATSRAPWPRPFKPTFPSRSKTANPALENRGVRTAPFVVLIGTQMPAILVEIACLSNEDEVQLLTKEDYRENIALALAQRDSPATHIALNVAGQERQLIHGRNQRNTLRGHRSRHLSKLDLRVQRRASRRR